jgi:succinate dehydrogenase / fumarate reductase, iron-sulfur subunit
MLFIRYAELDMHPNDGLDRRHLVQEDRGLGMCNITKCCTEVCPEHIKITDNGIIPMKERVVDVKYDPIRFLGRKLRPNGSKGAATKNGGPVPSPAPVDTPSSAGSSGA